jgi:hypothetical protein
MTSKCPGANFKRRTCAIIGGAQRRQSIFETDRHSFRPPAPAAGRASKRDKCTEPIVHPSGNNQHRVVFDGPSGGAIERTAPSLLLSHGDRGVSMYRWPNHCFGVSDVAE